LLTVDQAAELLNVRPSTIRAWLLRRKVTKVKLLDGAVRLIESELLEIIDRGTVPAREVK
jgi:excisionase family DNA binding protein